MVSERYGPLPTKKNKQKKKRIKKSGIERVASNNNDETM